eukprot:1177840-Prorocentrum_minimum.AAC.1
MLRSVKSLSLCFYGPSRGEVARTAPAASRTPGPRPRLAPRRYIPRYNPPRRPAIGRSPPPPAPATAHAGAPPRRTARRPPGPAMYRDKRIYP